MRPFWISLVGKLSSNGFEYDFRRRILEIMQTPPEIDGAYDYLMVIFGVFSPQWPMGIYYRIFSVLDWDANLLFPCCSMRYEYCFTLDLLLIRNGSRGVRYATAPKSSAIACGVYWKKNNKVKINERGLSGDTENIREHCRISFPMAFQASGLLRLKRLWFKCIKSVRTDFGCGTQHKRLTS